MLLAFTLGMPGRSSWDGRWSGEDRCYVIVRSVKAPLPGLIGYHTYAWSDGWCASVEVEIVDHRKAAKLRRRSAGFCGYDWMIESLLIDGQIITRSERAKRAVAQDGPDADRAVAADGRA